MSTSDYDDRDGSGFGAESTTDEVLADIDLSGKRYLVTGASGGLGAETTRALAARGATVVMAARDARKNAAALTDASSPNSIVTDSRRASGSASCWPTADEST
ncbi:MAG: SDR family NAD(P)-dependent oxidoreductase, partial [Ilumatobacteraceae bacterium]